MTDSDYFARDLLDELDNGAVPSEIMVRSNARARAVGFVYEDDAAVIRQLESEVREVIEAFQSGSVDELEDEGSDVERVVLEMIRLRGGDHERGQRENVRKYLERLLYVEERLAERGLGWEDVRWPDDVEPIWDEAKEARR